MKKKAIVLLSGGLDSSVNLYQAGNHYDVVLVVTFDYGQKAAKSELKAAKSLADDLGLRHEVIDVPFFKKFQTSSLLVAEKEIPVAAQVNIESLASSQQSAKSVWVPNRNGIFLNIAAGFAESLNADVIIPGFNIEEASTFPDNSQDFMRALDKSFFYSTSNHVRVECFTVDLNKTQIVELGKKFNLPFEKIWPCYFSGDRWCGSCESCQRSKRAFKQAGVPAEKYFKVN